MDPGQAAPGRTVAILLPLTGPRADLGQVLLQGGPTGSSGNSGPALDVLDTGGTAAGAADAAKTAYHNGDSVILGPLTSAETAAVAPIARCSRYPGLGVHKRRISIATWRLATRHIAGSANPAPRCRGSGAGENSVCRLCCPIPISDGRMARALTKCDRIPPACPAQCADACSGHGGHYRRCPGPVRLCQPSWADRREDQGRSRVGNRGWSTRGTGTRRRPPSRRRRSTFFFSPIPVKTSGDRGGPAILRCRSFGRSDHRSSSVG